MVEAAWDAFDRDAKNFVARKRQLKYQKYFDDKLLRITDPGLKTRARRLIPFIRERMLTNYQPYRKITALAKEIDSSAGASDGTMIARLEAIRQDHGHTYRRRIGRPRILYSMMVGG